MIEHNGKTYYPDANGWYPIECAPMDWTVVILYDPKYIGFLQKEAKPHTGYYQSNIKTARWETTGMHIPLTPTHWQPLPKPPVQEKA